MSDEWKAYVEDARSICKYGVNCYQRSSNHHNKYKHPPQNVKRKLNDIEERKKRFKQDLSDAKTVQDTDTPKNKNVDLDVGPQCSSEETQKQETHHVALPKDINYYKPADTELLKELFLVEMPDDFHKFFECLKEEMADFEKVLLNVNLQLIGPYELLLGKLPIVDMKDLYLIHWRFFYDPPEFQSVLKSRGKSEYHIGYFRDSPSELPVFVGSNDSAKNCHITPMASNIFGAVYCYLQNEKKRSPFTAMACQKFIEKVKTWADRYNFTLEPYDMKIRLKDIVTRSFHGAGVIVPFDKKTKVGYRNLVENDATIKKIISKIESAPSQAERDQALSELQPVITYASIAVDECDFGTGLELGIDLLLSGSKHLEQSALSLLTSSYTLLKKEIFIKIAKAHVTYRRRGANMSLLNVND